MPIKMTCPKCGGRQVSPGEVDFQHNELVDLQGKSITGQDNDYGQPVRYQNYTCAEIKTHGKEKEDDVLCGYTFRIKQGDNS